MSQETLRARIEALYLAQETSLVPELAAQTGLDSAARATICENAAELVRPRGEVAGQRRTSPGVFMWTGIWPQQHQAGESGASERQ